MGDRLLVIDEGTTSTRAMLFETAGQCLGLAQHPLNSISRGPAGSSRMPRKSGS